MTTTLPVLDCLWLEKMTRTAEEDGKPLLPTMATLIEWRSSLLSPSNYSQKTVANTMRERPSSQTATMFTPKQNGQHNSKETNRLSSQACRSTARLAQNPNQPRLLSTSCSSWHNMSRATWQLKATFATSQS